MNGFFKILSIYLLFSSSLWASHVMEKVDYWRCAVIDNSTTQWTAQNSYRLTAINRAYDACKKQSQEPGSCKASKEGCEAYVNGFMVSPIWQCTGLDFDANVFQSNVYRKKYDAALAAKAYCRDNSDYPDSCYVRLIGCENLNKRT